MILKNIAFGKAVELNGFEGANVAIDDVKSALDKFKVD